MSQVHVSRLLSHALGYLRPRLLGLPLQASGVVLGAAPGMDRTGAAAHQRRARGAPPASAPPAAGPDGLQAGAA
jgi:hypothetical protein